MILKLSQGPVSLAFSLAWPCVVLSCQSLQPPRQCQQTQKHVSKLDLCSRAPFFLRLQLFPLGSCLSQHCGLGCCSQRLFQGSHHIVVLKPDHTQYVRYKHSQRLCAIWSPRMVVAGTCGCSSQDSRLRSPSAWAPSLESCGFKFPSSFKYLSISCTPF